jgi:hypothetical protein
MLNAVKHLACPAPGLEDSVVPCRVILTVGETLRWLR